MDTSSKLQAIEDSIEMESRSVLVVGQDAEALIRHAARTRSVPCRLVFPDQFSVDGIHEIRRREGCGFYTALRTQLKIPNGVKMLIFSDLKGFPDQDSFAIEAILKQETGDDEKDGFAFVWATMPDRQDLPPSLVGCFWGIVA